MEYWQPQLKINEIVGFALQQLDCVAHVMRRCTVLLKDKIINHAVFHSS